MAEPKTSSGAGEPPLGNPQSLVSRALWQAQHAVEQAADAALAPLGVTTTLVGVLSFLIQEPECSAAEIARRARVAPQSVAKALVRLERLGLVERSPHPTHGRVQQLVATDAGVDLHEQAGGALAHLDAELLADLSEADRRRLVGNLESLRVRADRTRSLPAIRRDTRE